MIGCAFFGTLGRDAERKVSKNGKPFLRLNVRCGDGDGAQWIGVTSFDEKAIEIADNLMKGKQVYVEGKLTLDEWEAQDGTKRHGLSVMSWHTRLAQIGRNRPAKRSDDAAPRTARRDANNFHNDDIPF